MKQNLKKIVVGVMLLVMAVSCVQFGSTTAEAAKIKVVKKVKIVEIIRSDMYTKKGRYIKVDGKQSIRCIEKKKKTIVQTYPNPTEMGSGPMVVKKLFNGRIVNILKANKKLQFKKGDKVVLPLKIKKGVKILKLELRNGIDDIFKITATNKKLTLKCKTYEDYDIDDFVEFNVLFTYKGQRYYTELSSKIPFLIKAVKEEKDAGTSTKKATNTTCVNHTWNQDGVCTKCYTMCKHQWNSETGKCNDCGKACSHIYDYSKSGKCTICDWACRHDSGWYHDIGSTYLCKSCKVACSHSYNQQEATGKCTICGGECEHQNGTRSVLKDDGEIDYFCVDCGKWVRSGSKAPEVISRDDWWKVGQATDNK